MRRFFSILVFLFAFAWAGNALADSYTCVPGTYLPANATSCTTCNAANYCTGGTFAFSSTEIQGRTACPTGYTAGGTGVTNINDCKIYVSAGRYIATAYSTTLSTCLAGYYCLASYINYGSTGNMTACPTGYTDGGTGGNSEVSCILRTTAGTYIDTVHSTTLVTCPVGYYCPAANVWYGSTGSIQTCPAGYTDGGTGLTKSQDCKIQTVAGIKYSTIGAQSTCPAGYYCPAMLLNYGSTSAFACLGQTYSNDGASVCLPCPDGYLNNTSNYKNDISQCQLKTVAGYYVAHPYDTTTTICPAGYACPYGYVGYGSVGNISACTGATYAGGGTNSCLTCPGVIYTANQADAKTSSSQCQAQTTDGTYIASTQATSTTPCPAGYACPAALVDYGSTGSITQCTGATYSAASAASCSNCPTGYTANTTAGKTLQTQCQIQTTAGKYIATANDTTLTSCIAGYACPATLISYSSIGSITQCTAGTYSLDSASSCIQCAIGSYNTISGATSCTACQDGTTTTAVGQSSCNALCPNNPGDGSVSWAVASWLDNIVSNLCTTVGCGSGSYFDGTQCSAVGAGYWSANGSNTRTACTNGLTTIGFGTGADEIGDCGRILHFGADKIYLRSAKETIPSLNININGTTYYGNMTTDTKGSLRITSGGTKYSVYDDSM